MNPSISTHPQTAKTSAVAGGVPELRPATAWSVNLFVSTTIFLFGNGHQRREYKDQNHTLYAKDSTLSQEFRNHFEGNFEAPSVRERREFSLQFTPIYAGLTTSGTPHQQH